MTQWIWFTMIFASLAYGCITGQARRLLEAALEGTSLSVQLTLSLMSGYLLFCGFLELAKAAGAMKWLERMLRPLLRRIMPNVRRSQTMQTICANLSANMLGLGNAATPTGMQAMRLMEQESLHQPQIRHDMEMLLVINATGIQLIPTTLLTLRVAAGSAAPNAILLPSLLCSAAATLTGALLLRVMCPTGRKRND